MAPATMTAPTETTAATSQAAESQRWLERLGGAAGAARDALRERGIELELDREEEQ